MKKLVMLFVAMAFVAAGYITAGVSARETGNEPMGMGSEKESHWIGKKVTNVEGETLGTVHDLVWDSDGKISFAIISYGGFLGLGEKKAAIPFSALTYDEEGKRVTCNVSKNQLAGAPDFKDKEDLTHRFFAEELYRYYGVQPYWTGEGTMEKGAEPKGM
jgi:sporulation protein YlmC with PRC-barrel domain